LQATNWQTSVAFCHGGARDFGESGKRWLLVAAKIRMRQTRSIVAGIMIMVVKMAVT
jgi:hypothetical protein